MFQLSGLYCKQGCSGGSTFVICGLRPSEIQDTLTTNKHEGDRLLMIDILYKNVGIMVVVIVYSI